MKYCFFFYAILLVACAGRSDGTIIYGNLKNSGIKKVYLVDAYKWEELLDSCDVINDQFVFKTGRKDSVNLYSLYFRDSTGSIRSIEFKNRIRSNKKDRYVLNYFFLDSPTIKIYGDWAIDQAHYYDIASGTETKALFRTQMMQFGYLHSNLNTRNQQLSEYLAIIKEYPGSSFLLREIDANKAVAKKTELELMLESFSPKAIQTDLGRKLKSYVQQRKDDITFDNLVLEDPLGKPGHLFDTAARLNMIIVWASWCGPCRQEIPGLKELHRLFGSQGLRLTSISVDKDSGAWQRALKEENMPWKQLIVPEAIFGTTNETLEIGSIPYVLFLDAKGRLLSRSIGVDGNTLGEQQKYIKEKLNELNKREKKI